MKYIDCDSEQFYPWLGQQLDKFSLVTLTQQARKDQLSLAALTMMTTKKYLKIVLKNENKKLDDAERIMINKLVKRNKKLNNKEKK